MLDEKEINNLISTATCLEELSKPLEEILNGPYSVFFNGRLYLTKALVERIGEISIVIRPNDHNPPHYHIIGHGINVSVDILTGAILAGDISSRIYQLIKWWHVRAKDKLINIWDRTRPGPS